ncbi:MAG TPA: single-stranded-DNA-specific exonuclease RecJ [Coxiellaceae bacterium]|nr:MAG: single-stranded-DNA-specific exonuclease RecJ [Gammaproteobacteria bacterium RIFCSPHIGHO2_12_FULL_36_30]HLB57059.1 single-stranded-DNA-specific exonuclease RecJ [Coxiellaceae bacterium]
MPTKISRRKINDHAINTLSTLPSLLQRIYAARDVQSIADIDRSLSALLPFSDLTDIEKSAIRLISAITKQENILIIGDFDADGATSTAVAVSALKSFGAKNVDFLVPNRFTFGYGLTPEIVDLAKKIKNPHLIITVDNGIASIEGVARANEYNIDVVVTDHHLQGTTLPDAVAIVNPNRKDDNFKSKALAGVGVIFYVMLAVRAQLEAENYFAKNNIAKPNMAEFLDLVALGTVADVVPLDKNNRILVHQGLQRIRAGLSRAGIRALLQIAGRNAEKLAAIDLGFLIGPRLNAAGRLDDMSLGIHCLLENDFDRALILARQLDQLNIERRAIENEMKEQAFHAVDKLNLEKQLPIGICLYDETWHQGVIGLVASRVKDKLNRPTIAFAKADDIIIKGSARSVKGVHIRDVLDEIATQHPQLLSKFGGHAMAAGLSIQLKDFAAFSAVFEKTVSRYLSKDQLHRVIESDGELSHDDFTLENAELIKDAGPWGQQFPEPLFDGEFEIISQRLVGTNHLKLVLQPKNSARKVDAIAFQVDTNLWPNHRVTSAKIAYRLERNEFRGVAALQLIVEEIEC